MMNTTDFKYSEQGADSAWKGFTSQSLYILFRIINAEDNFDYYPEKLEDLMIMQGNEIVEVVQVKDYSNGLTVSDLDASTKSEGLFRRSLSLKKREHPNLIIRVIYFGTLGYELSEVAKGNAKVIDSVNKKLCDKYGFKKEDAQWLLSRLKMEKVTQNDLNRAINEKVERFVPTMVAPSFAKDLLAYYVFNLSKEKGKTSKKDWQEKIIQIGNEMSSFDGYSREYGGSLIRLADITTKHDRSKLEEEFRLGVSTRPEHIINELDLERSKWLDKIRVDFTMTDALVIKGASGQGKTALCYRYLYNNYALEHVFCIRSIKDQTQAENLIKAMVGLTKHYPNKLIIYIDVSPGEPNWTWILREAQVRSLKVKILVSIREEDFKISNIDTSIVSLNVIDLTMEKYEANWIYTTLNSKDAHPLFRTFEDVWKAFGESGPLLEFIFLLKNNETLKQRLETQVSKLITDAGADAEEWLSLLRIVCFANQYGCPSLIADIKKIMVCSNLFAALKRMTAEYLIRNTIDGRYLESLHPIRAKVLYDILKDEILYPEDELLLNYLSCSEKQYVKLILLNYFIEHDPNNTLIQKLTSIEYKDWEAFAGTLDTMIWLDVQSFIKANSNVLDSLVKEKGQGWSCFIPLDVTGLIRPNETIAERMGDITPNIVREALKIKSMFNSLSIDYHYCDLWINSCSIPVNIPNYDLEWMYMGYSLFWIGKREKYVNVFFNTDKIKEAMYIGTIEYKAAALLGIHSQNYEELYNDCTDILLNRIITDFRVIYFKEDDDCVTCGFVPPILSDDTNQELHNNFNHYWTMKMVDILSRIYPRKNYIEVNLLGVNLLSDFGIEPLDHTKKIPKENRPDKWITRINTWFKNSVDYKYRPNNWIEYINKVIYLRKSIVNTFSDLIKQIDHLYKKGYVKDINVITEIIKISDNFSYNELFLPVICVDKFGMYGEGNNEDTLLKASINLSISETSEFRKSLRDIFNNIQHYANHFSNILVARKNNSEITYDSKVHVSEFYIYSATKSLFTMQKEFNKLFSQYLDSDYDSFALSEKNIYFTLLGLWNEVMRTRVRRMGPLSYDANLKNKAIEESIKDSFEHFINSSSFPVSLIEIQNDIFKTQYFLYEFNLFDEVQKIYSMFCLELKKVFIEAENHNCFRVYLETLWPKMVLVLFFNKLPIGAFSIPMYKVLDMVETDVANMIIPELLTDQNYKVFYDENEQTTTIRRCIENIGKIRIILFQYNQVIYTIRENQNFIMFSGIENWISELFDMLSIDISILEQFFSYCDSITNTNNEDVIDAIHTISECFNNISNLTERMSSLEPIDDVINSLQTIIICMLFLSTYL